MTVRGGAPAGLARFARGAGSAPGPIADVAAPAPPAAPVERCELCAERLDDRHGHIADLEQRAIRCTCRACYLLFTREEAGGGRYRAIPDRVLHDPAHPLSRAGWERLQIPVAVAFFLTATASPSEAETVTVTEAETVTETVTRAEGGGARTTVSAFYPGPAGATECLLDLDAWNRLREEHPLLAEAVPDVEAIVVRCDAGNRDCYLVPIDVCYELVGRLRLQWRGFDGGEQARAGIDEFFDTLRRRARGFDPASSPAGGPR
ncbi:hypothetical protein KGA66_00430 [Actinocrinis puniceicyclus]|uniref:Uncharacterized protein n=1 Tax=Actinocrinis puniceicyclus TaxID=977794 RepID=A0A8J7WIE0_9ACTN|nr:DUF5947 family protein [Actinocrinis puniceicyclus]MBS2961490.1 hypothetical protein [Actinocrinis puniceicyclus]